MKYANFKNAGRCRVNIGDYLQFIVTDYLLELMKVPQWEIVYLGFDELADYNGEEVTFPFCYSIIDFVYEGRIAISDKIKPVFLAVTLSTVDKFMDVNEFLKDTFNKEYLTKYGPIGCRDEITYNMLTEHDIPAYINGCMTAIFPRRKNLMGDKVMFVDAPETVLPFVPRNLLNKCEFFSQQYYFEEKDIYDYRKMFKFVKEQYEYYINTARFIITSRLHVALPLTAVGIPVVLTKDNVDGRFSFIEKYLPIYDKAHYSEINWNPELPNLDEIRDLLITHALTRLQFNNNENNLFLMEQRLTNYFKSRTVILKYKQSHCVTHNNGEQFDKYAAIYWDKNKPIKYAFWGISENNYSYWKNHIQKNYPKAQLVTIFDSYRTGKFLNIPIQHPVKIAEYPDICIIVCSVGAAQAAKKMFMTLKCNQSRYCITSDCFISEYDVKKKLEGKDYDLYSDNGI